MMLATILVLLGLLGVAAVCEYEPDWRTGHAVVPAGVTSIGEYAFEGCDRCCASMVSIALPEGLTA